MGIKAGDVVKLVPNAVYYNGKAVSDWVKKETWIVKSVRGDRAVIDKNVSGTSSINSPINVSYLALVSSAPGQPPTPPAPEQPHGGQTPSAPSPSGGCMQISERGVEFIKKHEGCRLTAYKCSAGVWTIGYGHTEGIKQGDRISIETAEALLRQDLVKYVGCVNDCMKKCQRTFQPNQNQFDALVSFCYNCGVGNLERLVSGRSASEIAEKILKYNRAGGEVSEGLKSRREDERSLFLGKYNI